MFRCAQVFFAGSLLFSALIPNELIAEYSDWYATDFSINYSKEICNDQIKEIGNYTKATRVTLQRYTYCSSQNRLRGVQKFISHLQWYTIGGSAQWDAISVLYSDTRMIDTIMNWWVRTKDTWWNIIAAWDGYDIYRGERAKEKRYDWRSIIGIIENRWDKNPQTRYSFYLIRVLEGGLGPSVRIDTQRMNITQEEITAFQNGRKFDFSGFGENLNKAFLSNWLHGSDHYNDILSFSKRVYGDRTY